MLLQPLQPEDTLTILHIPKTAGTSFVAQIGRAAVPWAHVVNGRYYPDIGKVLGNARDHLVELKEGILNHTYRVVIGHMTRRDVIFSLDGAETMRFAAFIRDPVARFVSEYFYAVSPINPGYADLIERYPTLESFIDNCVDANVITHYLERYRGQPVADIISDLKKYFCFLGYVENYEKDARELCNLFSKKPFIEDHLNALSMKRPPIASKSLDRIREINARDMEFYTLVQQMTA
jgi:hypothetical protein